MEGRNGSNDMGPQGGDDHPRRAGQIAGQAVTGLLDRVVYLEAIVATREGQIADLDEEVFRLKDLNSIASDNLKATMDAARERRKEGDSVLNEMAGISERANEALLAIHSRAQGRSIGKHSRPIKEIPEIRHDLSGVLRRWRAVTSAWQYTG